MNYILSIDYQVIFINIMVLILIGTVYAAFTGSFIKNQRMEKIILSFFFSLIILVLMTIPFEISEGYFLDTRTVLLTISGLFLGLYPTIFVVGVAVVYRIIIGSDGMLVGIVLIVFSGLYGTLWRYYLMNKLKYSKMFKFFIFSFFSGLLSLAILISFEISLFVSFSLFFTVFYILLIPIITFILALIINRQLKNLRLANIIKDQKKLLQASIDSPKIMEIYVLDKDYKYLIFNSYHKYCMNLYYGIDIEVGDSFLDHIKNSKMYSRFRSQIEKALHGLEYTTVYEVETTQNKFYESMFTPIKDENKDIIGVGIFSYDVTKRKQYERNLEYINYHDTLTNVYNRRYYNEVFLKNNNLENYPLCIVLADVDSLKTVNDAFGHEKGDQLLIEAAEVLKNVVGDQGFVSRIGGDEFVLALNNTNQQMAENIISTISKQLEKKKVASVKLSMSIGYHIIDENESIEYAFKKAEDNMYKNKLFEKSGASNQTVNTIMTSLYEKNPREESHSQRVSKYCVMVGNALNFRKDQVNSLRIAGMLHDIGKIAIPDNILDKPGKLTDFEYRKIKQHPEIGYRILSASSQYIDLAKDILHHHEHYNGNGYPRGLVGDDIPLNSRIISIVDAYDAMTLSRPYRSSFTKEEAIKELKDCSGTQFDPDITKVFIKLIK